MTEIARLFCLHFAFGIACGLVPIRRLDLLSTFFRNTALVALGTYSIFAYLAWPLAWADLWPGALLVVYAITVRRLPPILGSALLVAAAYGMARQWTVEAPALTRASLALGAALMGFCLVAMNIGHSYLSTVKLPIRPLRQLCGWILVLLALRVLLFAYGFVREGWESWALYFGGMGVESLSLVAIFCARVLFGIVGAAILAVLTWKTVEIESTQSATGILYALLSMVLVGEGSALFLALRTKVWF